MRQFCLLLCLFAFAGGVADADTIEDATTALNKDQYPKAMRLLGPLAEEGNVKAQFGLGVAWHVEGITEANFATAASWYTKAAQQGHVGAKFNLGMMYQEGRGVPQDHAEALRLYKEAAEQGHSDAQFNLGFLYQDGLGVPQDYAEALNWYKKAAEQESFLAQNNLGIMYQDGLGVPQDYAEANKWFQKAAAQGNMAALANLGVVYESGLGAPKDLVQAYMWYDLANNTSDCRRIKKMMSREQTAEAGRLVKEWREAYKGKEKSKPYPMGLGFRNIGPPLTSPDLEASRVLNMSISSPRYSAYTL